MLRFILLDTTLFAPGNNADEDRRNLGWVLEGLCQIDQAYLKERPDTPLLYSSGVVYERPAQFRDGGCPEYNVLRDALGPKVKDTKIAAVLDIIQQVLGGERFRDIGRIIERGRADCDNLACWRVAELRQNGIKASPLLTWRRRLDGGYTYHVLVIWPDGSREDPSLLLGMGGEDRRVDREKEIEKNADRVRKVLAHEQKQLGASPGSKPAAAPAAVDPFAGIDGGME